MEGSTSEITAAATVSTITETKNKPPAKQVPKQKAFPFPPILIAFFLTLKLNYTTILNIVLHLSRVSR